MIPARSAQVTVTASEVSLHYSELATALSGQALARVPIADIIDIAYQAPTSVLEGQITVHTAAGATPITLAPGGADAADNLLDQLAAARRGELPDEPPATTPVTAAVAGVDFVAVDVETANQQWGSVCQIGAVRFHDGQAVDSFSTVCQPPAALAGFSATNTAIHGLSAEDVAGAPECATALRRLLDFIGDRPLVAHNAYFDASALRYAAMAVGVELPDMTFGCTLALSRRLHLEVADHRLPTLAAWAGTSVARHHDALADATACGEILVSLARHLGYTGSLIGLFHAHGLSLGELSSQQVRPVLVDRSGAASALQRDGKRASDAAGESGGAGTDMRTPRRGAAAARPRWQSVATPTEIPEPDPNASPDSPLYGHHVTITGDFAPLDKGTVWSAIAAQGAIVGKNVTRKTTDLVIGTWKTTTSKEKKAREYQAKGQDIRLLSAEQFYELVGLQPDSLLS